MVILRRIRPSPNATLNFGSEASKLKQVTLDTAPTASR